MRKKSVKKWGERREKSGGKEKEDDRK